MKTNCRNMAMATILGALLLTGCTTLSYVALGTPVSRTDVNKLQKRFPPTNPSQVTITTEDYTGTHEVIGEVGMICGRLGTSDDDLARLLQQEAAKYGANMVIKCSFEHEALAQNHGVYGVAIRTDLWR